MLITHSNNNQYPDPLYSWAQLGDSLTEAEISRRFRYYWGRNAWETAIVPKLALDSESNRRTMREVERVFQSANIIGVVVNRHQKALTGKSFSLSVTSTKQDYQRDADEQLTGFIRRQKGLPGVARDPIADCTRSSLICGVGYLRVYAPTKLKNNEGLGRLAIHSPDPRTVEIKRDDDGFIERIVYSFNRGGMAGTETQWVDDRGLTIFEYHYQGKLESTFALDLGGRFSIYELNLTAIVTDSVIRNQDAINHALTMIPRVSEYAGFLRDIILNGQPPGKWEKDVEGMDQFIPDPSPMPTGAGIVNYVQGNPIFDATGNVISYTSPQIVTHEPSSIQSQADSYKLFEAAIYSQVGQSHLLGNDRLLSGISRQQSRADFITMLQGDAFLIQEAIANTYMVALLMGNQKSIDKYKELSLDISLRLTIDQPLPDERRAIRDNYQAGLLSRQTAIALSGYVSDAKAEVELIKSESSLISEKGGKIEGSGSQIGEQTDSPQGL